MNSANTKSFLFLQTIASPFFKQLGMGLSKEGHSVHKINFNGGDWLFWHGFNEINFTGKPSEFTTFVHEIFDQLSVTDIVLFGDCRPWHTKAIELAKLNGIQVWVFEEAYLRPHWVTLEAGGVNGNSSFSFPEILEKSKNNIHNDITDEPVGGGLKHRISYDFAYNFASLFLKWKFPYHKTHRPYVIWHEYASWCRRLIKLTWMRKQAQKTIETLSTRKESVFLFPLQLDSDSQLRVHSDFTDMKDAIAFVIESFTNNADKHSHLLIKNHPLDNGMVNYRQHIEKLAFHHGIESRVFYIDGGDLNKILSFCKGVVTINSTVGMTALDKDIPVMVLGASIFSVKGLVSKFSDTDFWRNPIKPDQTLYEMFKASLMRHCHVNGNFYTKPGIHLAVANSLSRLVNSTKVR
ncbi:MAG: capsular biosynthesis protein [Sneathiella sp.]